MNSRVRRYAAYLIGIFVFSLLVSPSFGAQRTFNAGSYIIAADSCWQPNNDPKTSTGLPAYCDTNKNDKSLFQLFGMLYALLDTGDKPDLCINNDGSAPQQKSLLGYCKQIKVYWIIDNTKTDPQTPDLTLSSTDTSVNTSGLVTIYNSAKTKAGDASTPISYRGGPFVIDANDLSSSEFDKLKAKFPSVKIHKSNIPFSGNVDKVLLGKPPKIAVLNEGASDVLEAYIRAAGQFAWRNVVFQYVEARDILAGCLEDPLPSTCTSKRPDITAPFQLLWAPHWIVENSWGDGSTPTVTEQQSVIQKIREFLERGNSGFFECASIESMESSISADGRKSAGINIGTSGGFLTGSNNTTPRIQTNGGCSDLGTCTADYLKFEAAPFWLTQCGGWRYGATGGHVHNMRPNMTNSYKYLTTQATDDTATELDDRYRGTQLTRFIHDDASKLNGSYDPGASSYHLYDYMVGGRINGSPTQGYVVYLPGHSYIGCTNSTTYNYPPSRTIELVFDTDPPAGSKIFIEVVHTGCTHGSTCPTVEYDLGTGIGTRTAGSEIDLSAEFAWFDEGSNRLSGIILTSSNPNATTDLQVSDIYVTFDGNGGTVKLTNIVDLTSVESRESLCAPNQTSTISPSSPVHCAGSAPVQALTLTFSEDISAAASPIVTVQLKTASGTATATYDLSTNTGTSSASVGNVAIDLSRAVYDPTLYTLSNVRVDRGDTCADVTLTDIQVSFPGSGTLQLIYDNTTHTDVCSPGMTSPASCNGYVPPATSSYSIKTEIYWEALTPPNDTKLTLDYTCSPACSTSSISASRGTIVENADLKIDFNNISVTSRKISNITVTIKDGDKTVTITKITLTYTGSTSQKKKVSYTDTTDNIQFFSVSTKTNPPTQTVNKTIPKPAPVSPPSTWSYRIGKGICGYYLSPYLSSCTINWTKSNTCGIKYVLNTFLALKYQSASSRFNKTQPIVKDNILYKASYDYPIYRGHLEMIKVPTNTQATPVTIWDAATAIPKAGTGGFPDHPLSAFDTLSPRFIFTTTPGSTISVSFDPRNASTLRSYLGAATDNEAIVLINTVRGRKGASTSDVYGSTSSCSTSADGSIDLYGCDEDSKRLWAIENSTPALKTKSKYVESTAPPVTESEITNGVDRRDRFIFAGGDDGMLHAFHGGVYDPSTGTYPDTDAGRGTGKEIWAYIPSSLLGMLKNQPFNPDPSNESSFEPKVAVDGSPALGDFLICTQKSGATCAKWEWKTRLVGTASIRAENHGIVFALDVTNPYQPQVLWEYKYDNTADSSCSGTARNCNMGESKGVAIGTAQIGNELKDYVFLTSNWIKKKKSTTDLSGNVTYTVCDTDTIGCVYGVSAFALDLDTGKVMWEKSIPYTSDAGDIVAPPAVPALMDRDNNGSYDYVVFGDMQGRLWALRTTDGKNLTGDTPVYEVKKLDSNGNDTTEKAGYKEPIGAPVSVYRDYVVFGTGGTDYASNGVADGQKYRIEVVKIGLSGGTKVYDQAVVLEGYDSTNKIGAEQVWAKPAITSDLKVYVGTVRGYQSNEAVSKLQTTGRIIIIDLKIKPDPANNISNIGFVGGSGDVWFEGGFVGGFDFDRKHAYITTLKPTKDVAGKNVDIIQIGSKTDFSQSSGMTNPYKILWWRKM